MASRRSHAASHSRLSISTVKYVTLSCRVPRGHVSVRNPLQAPKERSCGISRLSPFLGPAPRNPQLVLNLLVSVGAWLCHANIVQRVKSCYKIKIDSRVLDCCFYGVTLCKQHPYLTIVPLLQTNSGTIRVQKWRYCMIKVALLECKSGAIATL